MTPPPEQVVGEPRPRQPPRKTLFDSPWPPLVAIAASLAVFLGVLLITPPGVGAVPGLLVGSDRGPQALAAAYAVGAAAMLALLTLLSVGFVLALVRWIIRWRKPG